MGTRADFYAGIGESAEWLGSIAYDGYPSGIMHRDYPSGTRLIEARTEQEYREAVAAFFGEKGDSVTRPEDGWPWPWEDSQTTDYAYAWTPDGVAASRFGSRWFDPKHEPEDFSSRDRKVAVFPNMKARQRVALGKRSGLLIISSSPTGLSIE